MYPLDMVKTRLQAGDGKISNPIKVAMSIIKNEGGIRGLYRGLAANLVGITPEKAIKLVREIYQCRRTHLEVIPKSFVPMCFKR